MIPVAPNPMLGVSFHGVGAALAANCYAPQKYVKHWSWEIYWMTQAAWCWLLWPILGAMATIPCLSQVLSEAPKGRMALCCALGMAYGIGGTAFNLSIRYIGFSLTYAIAVGLSSILGTLIPPLYQGRLGEILVKPGAEWVMGGIAAGALGIGLCGLAGYSKERDLRDRECRAGGASWIIGLGLSLVAAVFSAVYGIAITDAAKPIVDLAEQYGAGYWKGNIAYLFVNPGAFLTALGYSLFLAAKNRSLGQLVRLPDGEVRGRLPFNHLMAFLTGTFWYGQFFFYNLGHVRLGRYEFTSWAIHMIMLVLIGTLTGILFKEWRGCRRHTRDALGAALPRTRGGGCHAHLRQSPGRTGDLARPVGGSHGVRNRRQLV
ncbi:MAG: L-rhamnose/proton symporter RhaT [Thermoguttaceae bacterium]